MNTIDQLKEYDRLYFNEGTSPLTDTEYDLLKTKAKNEFPNDPYFSEIGAKIDSKFEEIKLPFTMGGLDKVDPSDVMDWIKKENDDIIASEKLDGNSIGCIWENNKLNFAASRGDGQKGQNLLNKITYCIPDIPIKDTIKLRGEVLLEGDIYKSLGFKNRRNAVTGLLRRDEIDPSVLSKLSVIFYELVEVPNTIVLKNEVERLLFIRDTLRLRVPDFCLIPSNHTDQIKALEDFLQDSKERANYDIDGLVLTRNNSVRENVMHPKNKVKFKVNELAKVCEVIGIEWNVTRVGYIKPVILINPTEILGVTVSRVSGFNADFIVNNKIGKGSIIGVVRSGDVIPYVTEVFKSVEPELPDVCPSCGINLIRKSKEIVCENPNCYQKNILMTSHFFIEMGVDGFSDKTIENIGIISIPEIYQLSKEKLSKIPGFGEKKAEIIVEQVNKTLRVKPEKLLSAFGMPLIGKTLSKQLCSIFTIDQLFEIKDPEVIGLGPITSMSLIDNIGNFKWLYDYLKSIGLEFVEEDLSTKTLKGLKFALTGEGPLKRAEIQKLIEELGGELKGISKDVNYLVTNDPDSKSGKMKSAEKFGIPVISYDHLFVDFLGINV